MGFKKKQKGSKKQMRGQRLIRAVTPSKRTPVQNELLKRFEGLSHQMQELKVGLVAITDKALKVMAFLTAGLAEMDPASPNAVIVQGHINRLHNIIELVKLDGVPLLIEEELVPPPSEVKTELSPEMEKLKTAEVSNDIGSPNAVEEPTS